MRLETAWVCACGTYYSCGGVGKGVGMWDELEREWESSGLRVCYALVQAELEG